MAVKVERHPWPAIDIIADSDVIAKMIPQNQASQVFYLGLGSYSANIMYKVLPHCFWGL
jgi:hypothetical protein